MSQPRRLALLALALLSVRSVGMGTAPPSEPDQQGRTHPPLQSADQPLGDIGEWYVLDIVETKSASGSTLTKLDDGSVLASGHDPDHDTYTVVVKTTLRGITAFRLDAVPDDSLPRNGPGRSSSGNFTLSEFTITEAALDPPGPAEDVAVMGPQSSHHQRKYEPALSLDSSEETGWSIGTGGEEHYLTVRTTQPVAAAGPTLLTFTLSHRHPDRKGYTLGRFRLSATTAGTPPSTTEEPRLQPLKVNVGFVPVPIIVFTSTSGIPMQPHPSGDASILIAAGKPIAETCTIELHTELESLSGLLLEALTDPSLPKNGPGRAAGNLALNEITVDAAPKSDPAKKQRVKLTYPTANIRKSNTPIANAIDGNDKSFWGVTGHAGEMRSAAFIFGSPVSHEGGTVLTITLVQRLPIGRLRLSLTTAREKGYITVRPTDSPALTAKPAEEKPAAGPKSVELYYKLGGWAYADPRGHQWVPARRWRDGRDGYTGGSTATADSIDTNPLLRTGLTGIDSFRAYIPSGRYRVALLFAEVRGNAAAGYRHFDARLEGVNILHGLDLIRETGGVGTPFIHVQKSVPVRDGVLDLEFTGEKPILNAIAITSIDEE